MIEFFNHLSIKQRLYLVILISVTSYVFMALYFVNHEKRIWNEKIEEKGIKINNFLAKICATPIQTFDYISIINYIEDLKKDQEIAYVVVSKKDNVIVTKEEAKIRSSLRGSSQIKTISSDITFYGQKIGNIETGISLEKMYFAIRKSLIQIALIFVIQSGIILGLFFLVRGIIRPIKFFTEEVKGIGSNSIGHKIRIESKDEIGEFAEAFNKMSDRLKEAHDFLEEKVKDRTKKLREEINERKQSEMQLQRAKQDLEDTNLELEKAIERANRMALEAEMTSIELNQIFDVTTEGILVIDNDFTILRCNKTFSKLTGIDKSHAIDKKCYDVVRFPICHSPNCPLAGKMDKGERFEKELEIVREDRTKISCFVTVKPFFIHDGSQVRIIHCLRDISEQKKMEEERIRTSKLESIGILAGGIAHDFNNLFTGILGYTDISKLHVGPESEIYDYLNKIEMACWRSKDLTQKFITFSEGGAPIKKTGCLRTLIQDSTHLALSGTNIRYEFSISDDLWLVEFDEDQMRQVINNLLVNARESMPDGGIIKIGAENITAGAGDVRVDMPTNGRKYVKISIQDHGIGIPEESLTKIFDPYFSTKERGAQKGMGLGLSTAYSIIKKHKGYIVADSWVNAGTTFQIYLPTSKEEKGKGESREDIPMSGKGKILLMDDEEMVRDVAEQMLSRMGYRVELAKDGNEAIERYKKAKALGNPIDIVIFDLTVRDGMGGKEAIQRLLEIEPDVKGIVSSGYSNNPVMTEFKRHGFIAALQKPFRMDELGKTIHEVLMETAGQHGAE